MLSRIYFFHYDDRLGGEFKNNTFKSSRGLKYVLKNKRRYHCFENRGNCYETVEWVTSKGRHRVWQVGIDMCVILRSSHFIGISTQAIVWGWFSNFDDTLTRKTTLWEAVDWSCSSWKYQIWGLNRNVPNNIFIGVLDKLRRSFSIKFMTMYRYIKYIQTGQ